MVLYSEYLKGALLPTHHGQYLIMLGLVMTIYYITLQFRGK